MKCRGHDGLCQDRNSAALWRSGNAERCNDSRRNSYSSAFWIACRHLRVIAPDGLYVQASAVCDYFDVKK